MVAGKFAHVGVNLLGAMVHCCVYKKNFNPLEF